MPLTESAFPNDVDSPSATSQRSNFADSLDARYNVKPFVPVGPPKEDIEYVDLQAIDLGKFKEGDNPEDVEARHQLAAQLDRSLRTYGFFYIVNHGISEEDVARQDAISQALHSIPEAEKLEYRSGGLISDEDVNTTGSEQGIGFKPRKYWSMANGVRDNIEFYNFVDVVHNDTVRAQKHHDLVRAYLNEIANYFQFLHFSVLRRLLTLCDIILKIPEGTLYEKYFKVEQNDVYNSGGGFGRLMVYYGHSEEENKKTDDTWLRGHSDSTGFTFIASQPMVSLQIRDYGTKQWRYVEHVPGALVVNVGDALEFLTGGYWRSTIHRVVTPPPSQRGHIRHSVIYFSKPSWATIIDPEELNSPHLKELGIASPPEWKRISFGEWDVEKHRLFGKSKLNTVEGEAPKPAYIHGRLAERWVPLLATES